MTIITAPVMLRKRMSHGLVVLGVSEQLRRIGYAALGDDLHAQAAALSQRMEGA